MVVDGLFIPEEVEIIVKIPLARVAAEDVLYWPYSIDGNYSCKSGYRFLKEEPDIGLSQQPSSRDKQFWKAIWSLRVPQKVKNLLW